MMIRVRVESARTMRDLATVTQRTLASRELRRGLREVGQNMLRHVKAQGLYFTDRTGDLRRSIMYDVSQNRTARGRFARGFNVALTANTPYARFVEEGTRYMEPRRYLAQTAQSTASQNVAIMQRATDRAAATENRRK